MSIAAFPHHYSVTLSDGQLAAGPRASIATGAPPEFGGTEDVWSPEHLLVSAVLSCLKSTFDAYVRRAQLPVHAWRGAVTGVLEKGAGGPVFTAINLDVEIVTDAGAEARMEELVAKAESNCIITRSLSAPVKCTARVTAGPAGTHG